MDEMKIYPLVDFSDEPMYGNNIEKLQLLQTLEKSQRDILMFAYEFRNFGGDCLCALYKKDADHVEISMHQDLMESVYGRLYVNIQRMPSYSTSIFHRGAKFLYSHKIGVLFLDEEKSKLFSLMDFENDLREERRQQAEAGGIMFRDAEAAHIFGEQRHGPEDFVLPDTELHGGDRVPRDFFNEQLGVPWVRDDEVRRPEEEPQQPPPSPHYYGPRVGIHRNTLENRDVERAMRDWVNVWAEEDPIYVDGTARNNQIVMRNNAVINTPTTGANLNFDTWNNNMSPIMGLDTGIAGGDEACPIVGT